MVFVQPTLRSLRHLYNSKFCYKTLYEAVFGTMETVERVRHTKMCVLKFDPNKGHPSGHLCIGRLGDANHALGLLGARDEKIDFSKNFFK